MMIGLLPGKRHIGLPLFAGCKQGALQCNVAGFLGRLKGYATGPPPLQQVVDQRCLGEFPDPVVLVYQ